MSQRLKLATLVNADVSAHDVVADAFGPQGNPWCVRFATGKCPIFASPLIGIGEQAPVEGLDQLAPLETYTFHCTTHPWMVGTLVAI